jgi:hypothetical protein
MNPTYPETTRPAAQRTALKWIATALSGLVVIMAFLAGQGLFGGSPDRITDHGYLGNLVFILGVAQVAVAFLGFQKGAVSRGMLLTTLLILVMIFAQIGLGYAGHRSGTKDATVVHFGLGVLLMGVSSFSAARFWSASAR